MKKYQDMNLKNKQQFTSCCDDYSKIYQKTFSKTRLFKLNFSNKHYKANNKR